MLNFHSDLGPELAGPDEIKPKHLGRTGAWTGEGICLRSVRSVEEVRLLVTDSLPLCPENLTRL